MRSTFFLAIPYFNHIDLIVLCIKRGFWESTFFVTLQVQNLNININFKPGSLDDAFQILIP